MKEYMHSELDMILRVKEDKRNRGFYVLTTYSATVS
jgi:hypothetical protein